MIPNCWGSGHTVTSNRFFPEPEPCCSLNMMWFFNYFPLCLCAWTLLCEKEFQKENRRLVLTVQQGRHFKYPFWLQILLQDSKLISVSVETLTWPVVRQLFTWGFCWLIFNEYFSWGISLLFHPPIQNWPCESYSHTARAHGPCSPHGLILRNKAGSSQNSWGFLRSDLSLYPARLLNLPFCIWQGMGPSYRF